MAWNEPGGNKDQDPWGNRKNQDGPPDLDEIVRKMQDKFGGILGGRRAPANGSSGGGSNFLLTMIALIVLVLWILSGIYIIDPAERGVVLRFGKMMSTSGPGPHWHIPWPVEKVYKVNVDELREPSHKTTMLTKDENLILIDLSVQYQVKNAENYLLRVRDPDDILKEASESALREVVGGKRLDDILSVSGGREILVNETEKKIQDILDRYDTGLYVRKVNLKSTQPPQQVQAAFEDAIKAREDEDRYKKQAEAFERDIIPKAEGDAQRLIEESEAYKQQVIEKARGETSRFLQTLAEYRKAPEITRKRLYLEAMEDVLSSSSKVLIKLNQGNNIMYLPLDRILHQGTSAKDKSTYPEMIQEAITPDTRQDTTRNDIYRDREGR